MAEHRIVLSGHVAVLLNISRSAASARLRALASAGYVRGDPIFAPGAACHQITSKGLSVIESKLPVPRSDLRAYRHDVGVAWLWIEARAGTFGALHDFVSERRMRSHDATEVGRLDPFAVRLGGIGPGGRECLHYPDLLLVDKAGRRVALELELTGKSRTRREKILAGYGADPRVRLVLYLADRSATRRALADSARSLGITNLVHVQRVSWAANAAEGLGANAEHHGARRRVASAGAAVHRLPRSTDGGIAGAAR
jgi:hypothetical protein